MITPIITIITPITKGRGEKVGSRAASNDIQPPAVFTRLILHSERGCGLGCHVMQWLPVRQTYRGVRPLGQTPDGSHKVVLSRLRAFPRWGGAFPSTRRRVPRPSSVGETEYSSELGAEAELVCLVAPATIESGSRNRQRRARNRRLHPAISARGRCRRGRFP